jgi:hypothetical protein
MALHRSFVLQPTRQEFQNWLELEYFSTIFVKHANYKSNYEPSSRMCLGSSQLFKTFVETEQDCKRRSLWQKEHISAVRRW